MTASGEGFAGGGNVNDRELARRIGPATGELVRCIDAEHDEMVRLRDFIGEHFDGLDRRLDDIARGQTGEHRVMKAIDELRAIIEQRP